MKKVLQIICYLLLGLSVNATTYYVSNNGNNANDGLSLNTAFATLQHVADIVGPGDQVLVENGTYTGFALWSGGTANAPITFEAMGDNVFINAPCSTNDGINIENADYVILDGFIVNDQPRNGIRLALADHCIVRNCRCDNNYERGIFTGFTDDIIIEYNVCTNSIDEHGIYVSNSSDRPIIRYNECYGNNNIGIHMNGDLSAGGDGIISDAQVYGNILHDNNLAAGINMDGVVDALVYNNLIYNNHFAQGIALFQQDGAVPSSGARIFNNTIIVPSDGRWGILVNSGTNPGTQIFNNIIINQHAWRGSITAESTTDMESDYNILINSMSNGGDGLSISLAAWQALGFDIHSLLASPLNDLFEDSGSANFHLKSGAQAIDAGTGSMVSSVVTTDLEGNARPAGSGFDIGAYEFQSAVAVADLSLSELLLFPNPFDDSIIIGGELPADTQFQIMDTMGRKLAEGQLSQQRIYLPDLPAGVYLLLLSQNEQRIGQYKLIRR